MLAREQFSTATACRLAIFGHKLDGRPLEVAHDRVIAMALAERLLVDADVSGNESPHSTGELGAGDQWRRSPTTRRRNECGS